MMTYRWLARSVAGVGLLGLLLAGPATIACGEDDAPFKAPLTRLELADGDSLVFLGDSITHRCWYTQYVEDYYYTRFPKLRIKFHNAGVGADRTVHALERFDRDVASFKPKYVTVLLGMNDGLGLPYDQKTFDTYQADMRTLIDKLVACGATPVLMTPSMLDARQVRVALQKQKKLPVEKEEQRIEYYNATLALYGAWLRGPAVDRGFGFVDLYSPLNNVTLAERKKAADFTVIPDAVHPEESGSLVMAYAILDSLAPSRELSNISIVRGSGSEAQVEATGGKVSDAKFSDDGLEFIFAAEGLPMVVPEKAQLGAKLVKLGHRLGREALDVHGLKAGEYQLLIDGKAVGTYTADQLERHIELQDNDQTPQYQQAAKVAELNQQKNMAEVKPMRDLWRQKKDNSAALITLQASPETEESKTKIAKYQSNAARFDDRLAKLQANIQRFDDRIYAANQPVPHRYQLVRVSK